MLMEYGDVAYLRGESSGSNPCNYGLTKQFKSAYKQVQIAWFASTNAFYISFALSTLSRLGLGLVVEHISNALINF